MKKYGGAGIEGIPPAPAIEKAFNRADQWFDDMKVIIGDKLPFLSIEEVNIKSKPYHQIRLHELLSKGYHSAVNEFNTILKKEAKERKDGKFKHLMSANLIIEQKDKIKHLVDALIFCQNLYDEGQFEAVTLLRKEIGEKYLKSGEIWLAKHFFFSALQTSRKMKTKEKEHFQAEIHCLLAFLARESSENLEQVLDSAINHLVVCRQLAKDQPWQFKPNVLNIRLKKPITLHGLRNDFTTIDGCSMTLYMIATLLEHEILIGLASQIMRPAGHHHTPTDAELKKANKYANHALKLAFEVRQTDALLAALMRYASVLRQCGHIDEAIGYFKQMIHQAEMTGDHEAYAISLQNLAHCQIAKHEPINALESLAKEKETCEIYKLEDLEADTLKQFGHFLLLEGHLWEAEECYSSAYATTVVVEERNQPHHSHQENTFVMWAIGAGQKVWSRFSCLARSDDYKNLIGLMEWKNRRAPLPPAYLNSSFYNLDKVEDVYVPFVPPVKKAVEYVKSFSEGQSDSMTAISTAAPTDTFYSEDEPHKHGVRINTGRSRQSQSTTLGFTWNSTAATTADDVDQEEDLYDFQFATDRTPKAGLETYNSQLRKSIRKKQSAAVRRLTAAKKQKESIQGMLDQAKSRFSKIKKSIVLPEIQDGQNQELDNDNPEFDE